MFESLDQLLVNLKHWVVDLLPAFWQPLVSMALSAGALIMGFVSLFAITVLIERKALGRIQNRLGPNRVGPYGLLQPLADFVKMLTKENIVPHTADQVVHFLAPLAVVVPVLMAYTVLPIGRNMVAVDFDAGLLFFFAAGACIELGVFMAGWSSRNKYSLLGGMRAIAQMISYEMPLILASVPVIMLTGSLSLPAIVEGQGGYHWAWLARWNILTPWGLAGFFLFMTAAVAESNRSPFDLPEGESEIIAGHLIEYSGFKYALFFIGEYLGMFAVSALAITLFLGGWQAPVSFLAWVPSYLWFFLKLASFIGLFIWMRGTLPRLRTDQLMNLAWKFLLPMVLVNLVVAALWHFTANWSFYGATASRWLMCGTLILTPYLLLSRGLYPNRRLGPRVYRFAT